MVLNYRFMENKVTTSEQESAATAESSVNVIPLKQDKKTHSEEEDEASKQLRRDISVLMTSADKQTVFSHPGLRALFALFSWGVMGYEIPPGRDFFTVAFLFIVSIGFDYGKFQPRMPFRKRTRMIGIIWTGVWAFVLFMGMVGALTVAVNRFGDKTVVISNFAAFDGAHIPFWLVYILLGGTIILTCLDWISESREIERFTIGTQPK